MKIVFAPDSFKNALSAEETASALAAGWASRRKGDELILLPLADGGEGTADAIIAGTGGEIRSVKVHDPLMREVPAGFGITGDGSTAVVELARASGIEFLKECGLAPLRATTYGTGELIRAALQSGVSHLLIGIGGSASTDGGAGMLQALGAVFRDASGNILPPGIGGGDLARIASADFSALEPRLKAVRLTTACDVDHPLTGPEGAAAVFGPQKGATPEQEEVLDAGLRSYARLLRDSGLAATGDAPGDGAAGGTGFALRAVLGSKPGSGAEAVLKICNFDERAAGADLILTGEGRSDGQTLHGKLCSVVAAHGAKLKVPVVLCSGSIGGDASPLLEHFAGVFSIASGPGALADAIAATRENLFRMGVSLAGLFSAGR